MVVELVVDRRRGRRWWYATIAALAVGALACCLIVAKVVDHFASKGRLEASNQSYDFCYTPPSSSDWQSEARYGRRFGMDTLNLSSNSARVTVTQVEPVEPSLGFELIEAAFVPVGSVALGTPGNKTWFVSDKRLLPLIQNVPAHLSPSTQAADWMGLPQAADSWQLAVRVRVPAYSVGAHVAGFRITYRSGWLTRTVTTKDTIRIGTTTAKCSP